MMFGLKWNIIIVIQAIYVLISTLDVVSRERVIAYLISDLQNSLEGCLHDTQVFRKEKGGLCGQGASDAVLHLSIVVAISSNI